MRTKLSNLVFSKKGKKPDVFSKTKKVGYLPYIDINLFDKGILSRYAKVDKKVTLVNKQNVLVVWDGARFGLSALGWQGVLGSTIVALQSNYLISRFLYYFLQAKFAIIQSKPRGVGIPHVEPFLFWNLQIPVPPLAEQKRIVKKIEELFAVIDKTVKSLNETKEHLAQYRQRVFKRYFHSCKYNKVPIKDLCQVVRGGSPRPAGDLRYYQGTIPFLKVADLTRPAGIFLSEFSFTIKEAGLHKTRQVPAYTLLLSNSGATLGVPKICTFDTTFNDGIAAFLGLPRESLKFHYYFWCSKTQELRTINQGAAQPNLNTTIIENISIPLPSLSEQKAIVAKIETAFAAADKAEKAISAALEQTKQLKQSILKLAFEGKLVPQDPNDEPVDLSQIKKHKGKSK